MKSHFEETWPSRFKGYVIAWAQWRDQDITLINVDQVIDAI